MQLYKINLLKDRWEYSNLSLLIKLEFLLVVFYNYQMGVFVVVLSIKFFDLRNDLVAGI